jgi:transcriptional regulator
VAAEELGLLSGTLDLLVLRTLAWGPQHGFAIAKWIKTSSDDTLLIEDRALYLALHRLEERGLVESQWGLSDNNRRARFYQLTRTGRKQLQSRTDHWTQYAAAVFKVLSAPAPTPTNEARRG